MQPQDASLRSQTQPELSLSQEPKQYTETELRALRRQYITLRHGTVRACGHKIDLSRQPKLNCEYCYEAWFKSTDGLLVKLHEELVTLGLSYLRATYGTKLVQKFARFLDNELDKNIDTSDIPEVTDWSKAVIGKFYRSERENAVLTQERERSKTEDSSGGTGVGSGEIQSVVRIVEPVGQEASDDKQLNTIGQESLSANQNNQHGVTQP